MQTQILTTTVNVTQADVLYVAQQIQSDLHTLSKAYPRVLTTDRVLSLFQSYTTFLLDNAVSRLGFSIYDPKANNLVFHEYRYDVFYGGDVVGRGGHGGQPILQPAQLPASAQFIPWVNWSEHMLSLSESEQEQIVSGTGWNIPGRSTTFTGKYIGGTWEEIGKYYSNQLAVQATAYKSKS